MGGKKNECGKTLTIDGLVKLLFNKTGKDFENLERVQEVPEGYVVLVDEEGNEYKIPEKEICLKYRDYQPQNVTTSLLLETVIYQLHTTWVKKVCSMKV